MPIAREFSPDLVLVSAGFDAAEGHPAPTGWLPCFCQECKERLGRQGHRGWAGSGWAALPKSTGR